MTKANIQQWNIKISCVSKYDALRRKCNFCVISAKNLNLKFKHKEIPNKPKLYTPIK